MKKEKGSTKNIVASLILGLLFIVGTGLFFNYQQESNSAKSVKNKLVEKIVKITVRKGYCLSTIAQDLGSSWQEMAELNKLKNPNFIFPGQKLEVIPFSKTKTATVSWYGKNFHGKTMSNREVFDMNDPRIAAHKWLPFGTEVQLTRLDSKKSVVVIVRDRGPYIKGRNFDLSRAAAKLLGIIELGVARCKVEILN